MFCQNRINCIQDQSHKNEERGIETTRVKEESHELDPHYHATKAVTRPVKFREDEEKLKGWQLDQLAEGYHWKTFKKLQVTQYYKY